MQNNELPEGQPAPKQCRRCGQAHPVTPEFWYFHKGEPVPPCKTCQKASQKARRQGVKPPTAVVPAPDLGDLPVPLNPGKALRRAGQEDMQAVINNGAALLKRHGANTLARVIRYANDLGSPHHEWACKLIAERVAPARQYGSVGTEERVKKADDVKPAVTINIRAATQAAPERPAIDVHVVEVGEDPE